MEVCLQKDWLTQPEGGQATMTVAGWRAGGTRRCAIRMRTPQNKRDKSKTEYFWKRPGEALAK